MTDRPTLYGCTAWRPGWGRASIPWGCGHVGDAMCGACYRALAARAHALAEENQLLRDAIEGANFLLRSK
jgi:hypothetical protein